MVDIIRNGYSVETFVDQVGTEMHAYSSIWCVGISDRHTGVIAAPSDVCAVAASVMVDVLANLDPPIEVGGNDIGILVPSATHLSLNVVAKYNFRQLQIDGLSSKIDEAVGKIRSQPPQ